MGRATGREFWRNNKCKGTEVRHILGIVGTRPGYGKCEREEETHWRFVRGRRWRALEMPVGNLGFCLLLMGNLWRDRSGGQV